MSLRTLMRQRATIERWDDRRVDANGELTPGYKPLATGVPCRVHERGEARIATRRAGLDIMYNATAVFPRGTDLRPNSKSVDHPDRVIVDGVRYNVVSVLRDPVARNHHVEALLETD